MVEWENNTESLVVFAACPMRKYFLRVWRELQSRTECCFLKSMLSKAERSKNVMRIESSINWKSH